MKISFNTIKAIIKLEGLKGVLLRIKRRIIKTRSPHYEMIQAFFTNKFGLEIGGPSRIFQQKGLLPIYTIATRVDGCNFSKQTTWEGNIREGMTYVYDKKKIGYQYIYDATYLENIPSETYDFILSSHSLEHIANPLKALQEWLRVLKNGGHLIIIVPNKKFTFDHNRPITLLSHLLEDMTNNIKEDDASHFEEILKLHDLSIDITAPQDFEKFRDRTLLNFENRCVHHHVFDLKLLKEIFSYFNINEFAAFEEPPFHLIIGGTKKSPFTNIFD